MVPKAFVQGVTVMRKSMVNPCSVGPAPALAQCHHPLHHSLNERFHGAMARQNAIRISKRTVDALTVESGDAVFWDRS